MSAHDDRVPDDELTRRYQEANAQDMHRPGAHLRQAVQAHAQAVIAAGKKDAPQPKITAAANQPRWKISMLASIALAGLTGLLVLQFDRGTPEEKELALGQPGAPAPAAKAPAPAAAQEATTQSAPAALPQPSRPAAPPRISPAKPAPVPAPAEPTVPDGRMKAGRSDAAESRNASKAAPAQGSVSRNPRGNPEQESGTPAASPFPASPSGFGMPAPPAMADRAMRAPAPAPAPAAAPAARARSEAGGSADGSTALLEAARSGRSADIAQLIRQGTPVNITDSAGRTPLMLAVMNNREAAVQQLLALGASRAPADSEGLTALAHARRLGLERIAALIEAAR